VLNGASRLGLALTQEEINACICKRTETLRRQVANAAQAVRGDPAILLELKNSLPHNQIYDRITGIEPRTRVFSGQIIINHNRA
jgi:hypothetical protein